MKVSIEYSGTCLQGFVRKNNEDNLLWEGQYLPEQNHGLDHILQGMVQIDAGKICRFGIFDGMGGHSNGETAAYIAAKTFAEEQEANLQNIYLEADRRICEMENSERKKMGTTACVIQAKKKHLLLSNIGDSKIYRKRGEELEQISEDHVVDNGLFRKAPLSQCLGINAGDMQISPYIREEKYHSGDVYLICSDGVSDLIRKKKLNMLLTGNLVEDAERIKAEVERMGATDNATFILLKVMMQQWSFKSLLGKRAIG